MMQAVKLIFLKKEKNKDTIRVLISYQCVSKLYKMLTGCREDD